MTMASRINEASWLFRLCGMVWLTTLMAFPFQALEPELYRKVGLADEGRSTGRRGTFAKSGSNRPDRG